DAVVRAILDAGGTVKRQYRYFDGLSARVPRAALARIEAYTGPGAVTKDLAVPMPAPPSVPRAVPAWLTRTGSETGIVFDSAHALAAPDLASIAAMHPDAYLINNTLSRVSQLHADGFAGQGIVVAVIDTGIRPGFYHLESDGSVIGCEDFVGDGMGCSNPDNDGHGTFVAGMISANAVFGFNPNGTLFRSVQAHLPDSIVPPNGIPMIGSAPLASIYALRVLGPEGTGYTSDILAGIDRAIELRDRFEHGQPGGVRIQVVNMSLGGTTLFAGRDLFDTATDALLDHDIVVVTSAGNAGPSGMTTGSPASAFSSLAVAAAAVPAYEQIVVDLQYGLGVGALWRPTDHIQTASFSSRGPNADGRVDPEISANGDWSFGQGFFDTNNVSWAGGTSFSSPTVAGIAATLRQAFPNATARQVTNALRDSANPSLLGDGSTALDQGHGYVDAQAARQLLAGGTVPDALPAPPPYVKSVKENIQSNAGLTVLNGVVQKRIGPLRPGQRGEVIYEVSPNTLAVVLTVSNFTAELPEDEQNQLFGDDILLTVHSAKTSRQPQNTGYLIYTFTRGGSAVLDRPESGLIRVTLNGDWTNAGDISADLNVFSVTDPLPQFTRQGKIREFQEIDVPIMVPPDVTTAEFRLGWREDWSHYPLNDIDMILVDPDGNPYYDGATLSDPEVAVIDSPKPGRWYAVLFGFELHTSDDKYELRVSLDGQVVK
ncbi:MAG TPA: S8 family serine peptidase, partial [Candidatus Polarisedimenticolia bacterium]|nr:S8 family serine peptidase [Candidatus Polarisedimenticolia bacterium]